MERGDLFGEMGLFDGHGRSAEARALEPSEVCVFPYGRCAPLYEARPALLWDVVALLADRIRTTDEALADSVFLDVTGRTAKRLLELAGDADEFTLPITQEELAGMVGASRERVNKAIASFVRLGWIDQADRRYRIIKRDAARAPRPLTAASHVVRPARNVGARPGARRRPRRRGGAPDGWHRGRSRARHPRSAAPWHRWPRGRRRRPAA